jgi:hypothetical protein
MTPHQAYYESFKIDRNCKLENVIKESAEYSYYYALNIIGNRFLLGEKSICKDARFSYCYARDVIKGRFEMGENSISNYSGWSYFYSVDVMKGRLSENMHNAMIFYADRYSKEYFDHINNTNKTFKIFL